MTKTLWIDPHFGASGDMLLGTMVALGADLTLIEKELQKLSVDGWQLTKTQTTRAHLEATKVTVTCEETHHHRHWSHIDSLLEKSDLPKDVIAGARKTFLALAKAEAHIHSTTIDEVHFHEVGAIDAIVDIVGTWLAVNQLQVHHIACGSVGLGTGTVKAAHGTLAVPAPATTKILEGCLVHGISFPGESVTPTGAALLSTLANTWGTIPQGKLFLSGRGAGSKNPETHANVTTGMIIESQPSEHARTTESLFCLTTNVDDTTAEVLGHTLSLLLKKGALDAWISPILMKKSRPAHTIHVLCTPEKTLDLKETLFQETGTLGIRTNTVERTSLTHTTETISIENQNIRIKASEYTAKPEYDDLAHASDMLQIPLRTLTENVLKRYQQEKNADEVS